MEAENRDANGKELKHLGVVRTAAIQAIVIASNLYNSAKQRVGPLRPTVGFVESTVGTLVGPVYDKFSDVPDHLLVFVDDKVDEAMTKFDKHAPPVAKQLISHADILVRETSQKARKVVCEYQAGGPRAAICYATNESKHLVLTQSVNVWIQLNKFAPIHTVADVVVPPAAYWSEKYNHVITNLRDKGYKVFGYVPLVPVDEISQAFKKAKVGETENEQTVPIAGPSPADSE